MRRTLLIVTLVIAAAILPLAPPASAHSGACVIDAYGRKYALNVTVTAPREASNWAVSSFEWSYHTSSPDDLKATGTTWHNNAVIKVVDPRIGTTLYNWPTPDDGRWGVTYAHVPKGLNGLPKPVWVSVGHGGYVEVTAWFDKKDETDPSCTVRIELDPPDMTKWVS